MKGGVAALLAATARLAREGHSGSVIVALTADEEHASIGMDALVGRGVRADAAVVCEPTNLAIMPATRASFGWMPSSVGTRRTDRGPTLESTPSSTPGDT